MGQMEREEALKILERLPLREEESKELFSDVVKKLAISEEELMKYYSVLECTERFKSQEKFIISEYIFTSCWV